VVHRCQYFIGAAAADCVCVSCVCVCTGVQTLMVINAVPVAIVDGKKLAELAGTNMLHKKK
jgi:hypothetical protein